jgi:transglutaminase-like putative cysteine protease
LPDKTTELLRIDMTTTLEKQTFRGNLWTDREGEIWKSWTDMLNLEQVRVTKEEALRATEPGELDFAWNVAVKVDRALERPHATKRVRYRVRLERGNPTDVFASGPSQQVRSIDPNTAEVTVLALRPQTSEVSKTSEVSPPTAQDREPNNWIQSDHPAIIAAAKEAAGDLKDPWQVAQALERYTRSRIRRPGFSQAFDTAADVIQSGEGDCTEHAVLLAALARAHGIPARVAIGLVYVKRSFLYHMWTEMHLDGRWIPMDATLAQGGIGAAHLKLVHSNLAGASALTCFLPVAQVIGRLKIEVLEIE